MLRVKNECHSRSIEIHNRWKKIAVNAKHLCSDTSAPSASRVTRWKSKDAAPLHPTVDMLTKPSFITDSQDGERGPSVTLIRRLVRNKPGSPISPQTYIHLVLQIYTSSYLGTEIQHDMRVYSALLGKKKKRGVNLSFFHEEASISQWPACLLWCRGWSNKLN